MDVFDLSCRRSGLILFAFTSCTPFSTGLAWSSVDSLRDKAHKVDGDGGARACSFTPYAAVSGSGAQPREIFSSFNGNFQAKST
eukprot:scaffold2595_cov18-Phaeocystis_antarctica.AAC.1